ncbi:hypothetical protein BJ878DRAFT_166359 [Calycina marina]|uniref:Uncharacterized protein n=1 Tax=Calycina marina TaxID=1763456 RepID=A0A9P7Z945_9HELO|nr:hypothetical protein BJ878DRAFT_166359 [Calycina marina]
MGVLRLAAALGIALAQQIPLGVHDTQAKNFSWNFNYSSSAPHLFASVHGLLKQWPNTFFPNGHGIVPCEIPAFTSLYHGRMDGDVPPSPEWLAFDIGMSYGIMGGHRNSHMLTYQTKRAVKVLYFDGESATLFGNGQMDTQMLHIYGNVTGAPRDSENRFRGLWDEYARAIGLCSWIEEKRLGGLGWGFEGIVRMNAGFELIWCDFNSPSIRLMSHLNVTSPLLLPEGDEEDAGGLEATRTSYFPLPPEPTKPDKATDPANPPIPPSWRLDWNGEPFGKSQLWNWVIAGTKHYGSNGGEVGQGENRLTVLGCGIMSYYANKFTSQAYARAQEERKYLNLTEGGIWEGQGGNATRHDGLKFLTRRRRLHTLSEVSAADAAVMRADSERVLLSLVNGSATCSGMNWPTMAGEIVQTYGQPLPALLQVVQQFSNVSLGNATIVRSWLAQAREDTHTLLLSFIQYPTDTTADTYQKHSVLFNETYSRCAYQYTRLLDPSEEITVSPEEATLKWAVEEAVGGICNVLVDVGLSVESVWQANFNTEQNARSGPKMSTALRHEVQRWAEGLEELLAWLGWADQWSQCEEKCAWDEVCFIPMWPLIKMNRRMGGGGSGPGRGHGPPGDLYPGYPSNRTRYGPPGRGGGPRLGRGGGRPGDWMNDETDLWQPRCMSSEAFSTAD